MNPFDFLAGHQNFKLKIRKVDELLNYDKSEFEGRVSNQEKTKD